MGDVWQINIFICDFKAQLYPFFAKKDRNMENQESKSEILARILGFLPPSQKEKNMDAVTNIAGDEEITTVDFDFEEIVDSSGQVFLGSPYTLHDEQDGVYR